MRLRHVKNASEIVESHKDIVIESPENYKGEWRKLFNKDDNTKLSLEIGCGKGLFLTRLSDAFKDEAFLGIEMMTSVICRAVQKIDEQKIENVKLINKDGANILDYFMEGEIDHLYVNFPDPWPKARHEKRRLTFPSFLEKYKVILKKDGIFRFKTDNLDLYNYSLETLSKALKDDFKYGKVEYTTDTIMTEFETKFRSNGNDIYYIEGTFK